MYAAVYAAVTVGYTAKKQNYIPNSLQNLLLQTNVYQVFTLRLVEYCQSFHFVVATWFQKIATQAFLPRAAMCRAEDCSSYFGYEVCFLFSNLFKIKSCSYLLFGDNVNYLDSTKSRDHMIIDVTLVFATAE